MFVHGGYWLKFDKSSWSHLVEGARAKVKSKLGCKIPNSAGPTLRLE
jgi:hypothetical protein